MRKNVGCEGFGWKAVWPNIVKKLAKALDDPEIVSDARRSCWEKGATDVAQVQLRCKSQKPPDELWLRVITGNAAYNYKSLAMWAADQARLRVRRYGCSHLVLSGVDFVKRIRGVRWLASAKLVKLDLKDFYLEG